MLSGAIAYRVLQQESPQTIEKVKTVLEKHPWYANQWQARLQDVPAAERDLVLFMQAASGLMRLHDRLAGRQSGARSSGRCQQQVAARRDRQPRRQADRLEGGAPRGEIETLSR
jgi:hypothetical protein